MSIRTSREKESGGKDRQFRRVHRIVAGRIALGTAGTRPVTGYKPTFTLSEVHAYMRARLLLLCDICAGAYGHAYVCLGERWSVVARCCCKVCDSGYQEPIDGRETHSAVFIVAKPLRKIDAALKSAETLPTSEG